MQQQADLDVSCVLRIMLTYSVKNGEGCSGDGWGMGTDRNEIIVYVHRVPHWCEHSAGSQMVLHQCSTRTTMTGRQCRKSRRSSPMFNADTKGMKAVMGSEVYLTYVQRVQHWLGRNGRGGT